MKIQFDTETMYEALQIVGAVTPQRSTIPMLQNVLVKAGKNNLELMGTDLEIGIRYRVSPVEVKEKGEALAVPLARLSGILRETTAAQVLMEVDGELVNLRAGDDSYKIVACSAADFPEFPTFRKSGARSVPVGNFGDLVRRAAFAASTEASRYALTGVLFAMREGEVSLVATDGKRLASVRRRLRQGKSRKESGESFEVLVPPKGLHLIEKILDKEDEEVLMDVGESVLKVQASRGEVFSRLVEGTFPDYKKVLPRDCDKKVTVERERLVSVLRRASLMTSEQSKAVKMIFQKGNLTVFARTPDVGEAKVECPIDYKKEKFEIVFNPQYVQDALRVMDADEVTIQLKDTSTAAIFQCKREDLYLVMPLRVEV